MYLNPDGIVFLANYGEGEIFHLLLNIRVRELPSQEIPKAIDCILVIHDVLVLRRLAHETVLLAKCHQRPEMKKLKVSCVYTKGVQYCLRRSPITVLIGHHFYTTMSGHSHVTGLIAQINPNH